MYTGTISLPRRDELVLQYCFSQMPAPFLCSCLTFMCLLLNYRVQNLLGISCFELFFIHMEIIIFLKKYVKQIERITMTNNLHFRLMNMKICRPCGCFLQKLDQLETEGKMMCLVCLCHLHCSFREEEREQSIREPFQLWDTTH